LDRLIQRMMSIAPADRPPPVLLVQELDRLQRVLSGPWHPATEIDEATVDALCPECGERFRLRSTAVGKWMYCTNGACRARFKVCAPSSWPEPLAAGGEPPPVLDAGEPVIQGRLPEEGQRARPEDERAVAATLGGADGSAAGSLPPPSAGDEPPAITRVPVQAPEPGSPEDVQFTVFHPKTVRPDEWYDLVAAAHLEENRETADKDELEPLEKVRRKAKRILGPQLAGYKETTRDSTQGVPQGGEITFLFEMERVEFNPSCCRFQWLEDEHTVNVRMRAGRSLDGQTAMGRMSVFLGAILLADVPLKIKVNSGCAPKDDTPTSESVSARPYRKIFASYSHQDLMVVEQFERFVEAVGDRYLRDVKDLRAGEDWDERLIQMIDEADVFQLFWSSHSMESAFVRREWEHALGLGRSNFVRPVYWEDPFPKRPGLPTAALGRIHFQRLVAGGTSHSGAAESTPRPTMEPDIEEPVPPRRPASGTALREPPILSGTPVRRPQAPCAAPPDGGAPARKRRPLSPRTKFLSTAGICLLLCAAGIGITWERIFPKPNPDQTWAALQEDYQLHKWTRAEGGFLAFAEQSPEDPRAAQVPFFLEMCQAGREIFSDTGDVQQGLERIQQIFVDHRDTPQYELYCADLCMALVWLIERSVERSQKTSDPRGLADALQAMELLTTVSQTMKEDWVSKRTSGLLARIEETQRELDVVLASRYILADVAQSRVQQYGPSTIIDVNYDYPEPRLASFGQPGKPGANSGRPPTEPLPYRAEPLKNGTPLSHGVKSGVYMRTVGGVAFDKVAQPALGLSVESLSLTYDRRPANDGQRLVVRLNNRNFPISGFPDWQLVPIARYVDSPYFAIVTPHGQLIEGELPAEVASGNGYVIALHPALEYTLLGMRMFNANHMLLDPVLTGELPRDDNRYVLGKGENAPVGWQWRAASIRLNDIFRQPLAADIKFQSYVICDQNVQPKFGIERNQLQLTGDPYFYFWNSGDQEVVERGERDGLAVMIHTNNVVPLTQLSDAISQRVDLLMQANPAVYSCLVKTMRFSAFFRYCKEREPEKWKEFMTQLDDAEPAEYRSPTPVIVRNLDPKPRVIVVPAGMSGRSPTDLSACPARPANKAGLARPSFSGCRGASPTTWATHTGIGPSKPGNRRERISKRPYCGFDDLSTSATLCWTARKSCGIWGLSKSPIPFPFGGCS
jgi:hypothetical protein